MNNNPFCVVRSDFEEYRFVVYSIKGENILSYLSNIEEDIQASNLREESFLVLFDTLLYSNNSQKRFLSAKYKEDGFDKNSFEFINVPKKDYLREQSLNFFISNSKYIENSTMLNSIQKKIILKGIPI